MNIYIPKHLRRLDIVNNLCKMIMKYQEVVKEEQENKNEHNIQDDLLYHFNKYKALSYDPVKRFVGICINPPNSEKQEIDKEIIENKVNYITEVFYSLAGSYKIFEKLKTLLGLELSIDYNISLGHLKITLEKDSYNNLFKLDEDLFHSCFFGFLESLLFFKKAEIIYNEISLTLEKKEKVITKIANPILYSLFDITIE